MTMDQRNDDLQKDFACRLEALATTRKSIGKVYKPVACDNEMKSITDTFRWLRNNCPLLDKNSKCKLLELGLVETCSWFCDFYFRDEPLSRSILLQFLANFSMNNETAQQCIFNEFHSLLRYFIQFSDSSKLLNSSIMLFYNLCLVNNEYRLNILKDVELIQKILTHWSENEIEYSKIFLDSIFSNSKDFIFVYTNIPDLSKINLMNLLAIWLDHYKENVTLEVIFGIIDNYFMDCTLDEISRHVVNVLAKASYIEKFRSEIQNHTLLLKKLIDLLTVIHERGRNNNGSNNEFSRETDLSTLFVNSNVQTHKQFCFKSDIIRLIANMCYNHQEHQNLIRSNNIILILLECCSFDAKNPLIREWSLFALRNILEGNLDNQNFVANIDSVGSIDTESSVMLTDTLGMATIKNSSLNNDTMFI